LEVDSQHNGAYLINSNTFINPSKFRMQVSLRHLANPPTCTAPSPRASMAVFEPPVLCNLASRVSFYWNRAKGVLFSNGGHPG